MNRPTVWDTPEPEAPSDKCPEPGVYRGIDFDEYCQWDAINHSKLQRIDKSPLHCFHSFGEETKALRLGQLVHTGQLEPDSLKERYAIMGAFQNDPQNTTKDGKRSYSTSTTFYKESKQAFEDQAKADSKKIVTQAEFDSLQQCLLAIAQCPDAVQCLAADQVELSIVWNDRHTGLLCKARIDAATPTRLADLKTKEDSRSNAPMPIDFEYSLWSYNYYTQAAWYRAGWKELTGDTLPFWFVVVSTTAPSQCIAAPVGQMTLQAGEAKNIERMSLYAECKRSGVWPGYESPAQFELPERYLDLEG